MSKNKKMFYTLGLVAIIPTTFVTVVSCGVNIFVNKTVNTDNYKFPNKIEFTGNENGTGTIKDTSVFGIPNNTQILYQVNKNGYQVNVPKNLRLFDVLDVKITGKPNYVITKEQSQEYKVTSGFGNILSTESTEDQLKHNTTFLNGTLTINKTVDEIQTGLFDEGTYMHGGAIISKIVFEPDSQISIINDNAFQKCNITTLDIPSSLEYICNNAFEKAILSTLNINADSKLILIGSSAFESSTLINKSLVVPNNVTTIGNSAFENAQLSSLTFPGTALESIETKAFNSLHVQGLTIPYSVKTIGDSAFGNVALETLTFQSTNDNHSHLQTIGASAFSSSLLKTLIIPSVVQTISSGAFLMSPITNLTFLGDIPSSPSGRTLVLGNQSFFNTSISAVQGGDHSKDEWIKWLKKQPNVFKQPS